MKCTLALSLIVGVVASGYGWGACDPGRIVRDLTAPQGGANDLNGDGKFDISDLVYGLSFLFLGGPPPCPLKLYEDCRGALPATGQTVCWDTNYLPQGCQSVDLPGQDGSYQAGCPVQGRFADNGDGTVTDNCTGLMWQQEMPAVPMTWKEAIEYCENRPIKYDDWRLPNVRELQSLIDYSQIYPAITRKFFTAMNSGYWTSTTVVPSSTYAWYVDFYSYNGQTMPYPKASGLYVRAVRNSR